MEDVRASFQAKAMAQRVLNALQKQTDLKHKKELEKLKKFWDILKTTNQHHTKWEKKQAQTHVNIFKKYRNRRK